LTADFCLIECRAKQRHDWRIAVIELAFDLSCTLAFCKGLECYTSIASYNGLQGMDKNQPFAHGVLFRLLPNKKSNLVQIERQIAKWL